MNPMLLAMLQQAGITTPAAVQPAPPPKPIVVHGPDPNAGDIFTPIFKMLGMGSMAHPTTPQQQVPLRPPGTGFSLSQLPSLRSETVIPGAMPAFQAPAAIPDYVGPDLTAAKKLMGQAFTMPKHDPYAKPIPRPAMKLDDPSAMIAKMHSLTPIDTRVDEKTFKKNRMTDALAQAALAASKGDDLGQVLALAGGAFGSSMKEANEERRVEDLNFKERQRQFDLQMASLDYEGEKAKNMAANATTELEFLNAQDMLNYTNQEKDRIAQEQAEERQIASDRLSTELSFAKIAQETETGKRLVEYQNKQQAIDWANKEVERRMPKASLSDDGSTLTSTVFDKDGNAHISTEPVGLLARLDTMNKFGTALGVPDLFRMGQYQEIAKQYPQALRRTILGDVLRLPGSDKILDPKAGNLFYTSYADVVADRVEKQVRKDVEAGRIPPDQAPAYTAEYIARGLEPFFDDAALARAEMYGDDTIKQAIALLRAQNSQPTQSQRGPR